MSKPRILIIEHELDQLDLYRANLSDQYQLLLADSAEKAIGFFESQFDEINLIVLNLKIPIIDGYDIYQKFESISYTKIPNIILMSDYDSNDQVIDAIRKTHAFMHLSKPCPLKELLAAIEKGLSTPYSQHSNDLSKQLWLNQIITDRNILMLGAGQQLDSDIAIEQIPLNSNQIPLEYILQTLEEDTGIKRDAPWSAHILLVEDEEDALEILEFTFQDFKTFSAKNISEAIDHLESQSIDIIILDLGLKHENGFEIIKRLRSEGPSWTHPSELKSPDIIVLTAYSDKEVIHKTLQAGANHYLNKPCLPSRVLSETDEQFKKRYQHHQIDRLFKKLKSQELPYRFQSRLLNHTLS